MRLVGTLALCMIFSIARSAGAQEETVAEVLFRSGRDDLKREAYAEACPKFRESQRLDPSPGTLLNLAVCEERIGRIATAWTTFREVLDTLDASDPRAAIAREHLAAIEPNLPRLRLRPTADQPLVIRLNGVPLGAASLGLFFPIDPGKHQLEISAKNGTAQRVSLVIGIGEQVDREIAIAAPSAAAPKPPPPRPPTRPAPPPPATESSTSPLPVVVGLAVAGAGIVTAGIASYFALDAKSLNEDSNANGHCVKNSCDPTGASLRNRALEQADTATVLFVASGVLVGGGLGLFFLTRKSAEGDASGLRVGLSVSREGMNLGAAASF